MPGMSNYTSIATEDELHDDLRSPGAGPQTGEPNNVRNSFMVGAVHLGGDRQSVLQPGYRTG